MKKLIFVFVLISFSFLTKAQSLSLEEKKLYSLIMEYRASIGLSKIPLSKSLTTVAQAHCYDLVTNKPDLGNCNAHSWSANGKWSSCCYTPDHKQSNCMWNKPKELTNYSDIGFEIACGSNVDSLSLGTFIGISPYVVFNVLFPYPFLLFSVSL